MAKRKNFSPGDLVRRRQLNFGGPAFAQVVLSDLGVFVRCHGDPLFEDGDQICEVLFQGKRATERLMVSNLEKLDEERN